MKRFLKTDNLKIGVVLLLAPVFFAVCFFMPIPYRFFGNILFAIAVIDIVVFLFCILLRAFDPKSKVSIVFELLTAISFAEVTLFMLSDGYGYFGSWDFVVAAVFKDIKLFLLFLFYENYFRKKIVSVRWILAACLTYDVLCRLVPRLAVPLLAVMALLTAWTFVKICKEKKKKSLLFAWSHFVFMFGTSCGVTLLADSYGGKVFLCSFFSTSLSCLLWFCLYLRIIVKVRNDEVKTAKKDIDFKSEEMSVMLSQIKPHFIYNTLNTIQFLCRTDGELAADTIADFSDYLRTNLNFDSTRQIVPFEEELEHINKYLKIEKLRFRHRLMVKYDIQETGFFVPTLSLQPIIENAVKHGISKRLNGGTIIISTYMDDDNYVIRIKDNGVGFTEEEVEEKQNNTKRKSLGMKNIKNRIETLLGGRLEIESRKERGTTAWIYLPIEKNMEGEKNENSLY